MKGFKLSEFCEREGMDFKKASMLLDEAQDHLMNVMGAKLKADSDAVINSVCEKVTATILAKLNEVKKSSQKKSSKGPFYAPCREKFTCHAEDSYPNGDGTMTLVFKSLEERPYGNKEKGVIFKHELRVNQIEFVSLFYDVDVNTPLSGYKARNGVLETIPNLPSPEDLANNVLGYMYSIELKRAIADLRESPTIISITPCGVMQNDSVQL